MYSIKERRKEKDPDENEKRKRRENCRAIMRGSL
jgi:hypothetical protein